MANYGELIRRIGDETGATIMILWGPGEEAEARHLGEMAQGRAMLACPTTVSQALALLKRTTLYIGGDTGVMHLAALAGVPVVAIFGPTDHLVNGPYGDGHEIVRMGVWRAAPAAIRSAGSVECLKSITVDDVFRAVLSTPKPGGEELMRVLFIYPNLNAQIGFNYGIAYISGLLKAHGIETALLNINDQLGYPLDLDRIGRDVERIAPDLIGFSVLTNQYKYALEIARHIRKRFDGPIVFGGIHPTMDPEGVLAEGIADYICVGEGEEAFLEAVEKGSPEGRSEHGVSGQRPHRSRAPRPYTDIRALPPKDYEVFDFQSMIDAKDGWVGLLASRGCPFSCTYCLNHKIIRVYKDSGCSPKLYIRRHSVDQVMGEIDYLLSRYGPDQDVHLRR